MIILLTSLAVINILVPKHMDFAVYFYDIRAFLEKSAPLYGPGGAMGWPMLFRYPPPFIILFYPSSTLSFATASYVWMVFETVAFSFVAYGAYVKLRLEIHLWPGFAALAVCAPYLYLSFKDGNMQWLVVLLVFVACLIAEALPVLAGLALALGIAVKVWPALFIPLFFGRDRRRALLATLAWSLLLWGLPIIAFGPAISGKLFTAWFSQEFANHAGVHDIWYPSQSLRGVLLRFFTDPALTLPYRSDFPDVHLYDLPPWIAIGAWIAISAPILLYVIHKVWVSHGELRTHWDMLYFVAFSALQPNCNWSSLVSLAPALLLAAHICSIRVYHSTATNAWLATLAAVSSLTYAASLSRASTRLFEALGLHFALMFALGVYLWLMARQIEQNYFFLGRRR